MGIALVSSGYRRGRTNEQLRRIEILLASTASRRWPNEHRGIKRFKYLSPKSYHARGDQHHAHPTPLLDAENHTAPPVRRERRVHLCSATPGLLQETAGSEDRFHAAGHLPSKSIVTGHTVLMPRKMAQSFACFGGEASPGQSWLGGKR
jgi:hypothetical protein